MIYIIKGKDKLFIEKKLKELTADYDDVINFNGSTFNFSIKEMLEACTGNSLFSDKNCVVVYDPYFLIYKTEDEDKDVKELLDYCKSPLYENTLIFYTLDNSFNEKLVTYKEIAKNAQIFNLNQLRYKDFENYSLNEIKNSGIDITNDARKILISSSKNDAKILDNNLEVLKLYPGKIDKEVLSALCIPSRENEAFDFVDAIFNKDLSKAFVLAKQILNDNGGILGLMGLIASKLRLLYYLGYLKSKGYSFDEIVNITDKNSYYLQKTMAFLNKLDYRRIPKLLSDIADLNYKCKSDNTLDDVHQFELFLIRLIKS